MIPVFIVSAGLILYVVVIYPLVLGLLARCFPKKIRKQFTLKTVTVLIPACDGEPWIRKKLRSVLGVDYPTDLLQTIVISDGSTDGTDDIVREFAPQGVQLVRVPPGGKCAALNAGMEHAQNEILVMTDVRQELDPSSLRHLIACFGDPAVGVVSGALIIRNPETHAEINVGHYWAYESWIREQLSAIDSTLGATGPFYAIRRELAVPIPPEALLDDVYLPLAAFFRGYRLVVEKQARAFDYPTGLETEFRRKVRTLAGNLQILRFYPALLGPGNRMWLHFVSCKLGRLLLPYAFVLLAVATLRSPGAHALAALSAQALFYCLALIDVAVPETWPLKQLTSPARTIVVLVAAAFCAIVIFFVPARKLWKPTRTRLPA